MIFQTDGRTVTWVRLRATESFDGCEIEMEALYDFDPKVIDQQGENSDLDYDDVTTIWLSKVQIKQLMLQLDEAYDEIIEHEN